MAQILHLPISKKWFDMIVSGNKKVEYRDIKTHWVKRMIGLRSEMEAYIYYTEFLEALQDPCCNHSNVEELLYYFDAFFRRYDLIKFRNGYRPDSPTAIFKWEGCEIGKGVTDLGASGEYQFIIKIGDKWAKHY